MEIFEYEQMNIDKKCKNCLPVPQVFSSECCHPCSLLTSLSALFLCTLTISVLFAAIPLCHRIVPLFVTMAITGGAMGVIDTIGNYQLVNLYQRDSDVFLQVRSVCVCERECVSV